MDAVTIEQATYIFAYYTNLLTAAERVTLRHYQSTIKLENTGNEKLLNMYQRVGWMSDNPEVLNYLKDGYLQFIINCSQRILQDNPGKVFFNLCPNCGILARTPFAKQCRYCNEDWH